jgi:hypothetical protein
MLKSPQTSQEQPPPKLPSRFRLRGLLFFTNVLVFLFLGVSHFRELSPALLQEALTRAAQSQGCSSLSVTRIEPSWNSVSAEGVRITCGPETSVITAQLARIEIMPKGLSLSSFHGEITGGDVQVLFAKTPPLRAALALQFATNEGGVQGTFQIPKFALRSGNYEMPVLDWSGEFSLLAQNFSMQFKAKHSVLGELIKGTLSHSLENSSGTVEADVAGIDLTKQSMTLAQLHPSWPFPIDLEAGKLAGSLKGNWGQEVRMSVQAVLLGGKSTFQSIKAENIDTDLSLQILPKLRSARPAKIKIGSLESPVPLSNLSATLSMPSVQVLQVSDVSIEVLGGLVKIPETSLRLGAKELDMRLPTLVEGIQLAEVLRLYPQEGLHAEGQIDGKFEMRLDAGGPLIEGGKLMAREPGGVIAYELPQGGGEAPPALVLSTEVLKDFRYHALEASVDLIRQGDLTLGLSLRGYNPAWHSGRPVNLNINLNDNVYTLWRSLQLARGEGAEFGEIADGAGKQGEGR